MLSLHLVTDHEPRLPRVLFYPANLSLPIIHPTATDCFQTVGKCFKDVPNYIPYISEEETNNENDGKPDKLLVHFTHETSYKDSKCLLCFAYYPLNFVHENTAQLAQQIKKLADLLSGKRVGVFLRCYKKVLTKMATAQFPCYWQMSFELQPVCSLSCQLQFEDSMHFLFTIPSEGALTTRVRKILVKDDNALSFLCDVWLKRSKDLALETVEDSPTTSLNVLLYCFWWVVAKNGLLSFMSKGSTLYPFTLAAVLTPFVWNDVDSTICHATNSLLLQEKEFNESVLDAFTELPEAEEAPINILTNNKARDDMFALLRTKVLDRYYGVGQFLSTYTLKPVVLNVCRLAFLVAYVRANDQHVTVPFSIYWVLEMYRQMEALAKKGAVLWDFHSYCYARWLVHCIYEDMHLQHTFPAWSSLFSEKSDDAYTSISPVHTLLKNTPPPDNTQKCIVHYITISEKQLTLLTPAFYEQYKHEKEDFFYSHYPDADHVCSDGEIQIFAKKSEERMKSVNLEKVVCGGGNDFINADIVPPKPAKKRSNNNRRRSSNTNEENNTNANTPTSTSSKSRRKKKSSEDQDPSFLDSLLFQDTNSNDSYSGSVSTSAEYDGEVYSESSNQ